MKRPTAKEIREFLWESNAIEDVNDEDSFREAKEAWTYLMKQKKMTPAVVRKTHKILMRNHLFGPYKRYAGKYRDVGVWIGGKPAIDKDLIEGKTSFWCKTMNVRMLISFELAQIASRMLHVEYEKIHPFIDGNGRSGRMFMNWWRLRIGLPLLIIHAGGKEQQEYYRWFK